MPSYAERPSDTDSERASEASEREDAVVRRVRKGLRVAGAVYAGDRETAVEGLLGATDLPALAGAEPLVELAQRLDAEADMWRNLAVRSMARSERAARLVTAASIVAALLDLGLSALAALVGFWGVREAGGHAVLLGLSATIVTLGLGSVAVAAWLIRRGHRDVVRMALARADVAELRLHRIALALAVKGAEPSRFGDALARLERDAGA